MRRAPAVCVLALLLTAGAPSASAAPVCRTVEVSMMPVPHVQMAVWVEDENGNYIDTVYVTRLTGTLGLANRPGMPTFKSDFRFPYGSREMVMPVWAHKRNHLYGKVVMGGENLDNSKIRLGDTTDCGSNCRNDTIGYHSTVSSPEPFYCGPSGGTKGQGLDATSCASSFYGSKGAYLANAYSYYPPRADLTTFQSDDSNAAMGFSTENDLGAVSGATPPGNAVIDPPIRWTPPGDGRYVMKVEVSKEFDFNAYHDHPPFPDGSPELQSFGLEDAGTTHFGQPAFKYGQGGYGQPSIVYATPFTVGDATDVEVTSTYVGYGDWDGATGTLHGTDMTITDGVDGTGVGRLLLATDDAGSWRLKVRAAAECGDMSSDGGKGACVAPDAPVSLMLSPDDTDINVSFSAASGGAPATRFDVRYRAGQQITDGDFLSAIPSSVMPPPPSTHPASVQLTGLRPQQPYYVAVRSIAMCGAASKIATQQATTTQQQFVTLHGCFIATAAYGSPVAQELDILRTLRDKHLVTNGLGRVFVGTYYAFSPPLANAIARDDRLRAGARVLIEPLVRFARAIEHVEQLTPHL
jgi:hypothetical protein